MYVMWTAVRESCAIVSRYERMMTGVEPLGFRWMMNDDRPWQEMSAFAKKEETGSRHLWLQLSH